MSAKCRFVSSWRDVGGRQLHYENPSVTGEKKGGGGGRERGEGGGDSS